MSLQAQIKIKSFNHLNINQQAHIVAVNDVLITFEGNINPGYPTGIKLYLRENKEVDKETNKLDVPVSNAKDGVDNFLCLANKYGYITKIIGLYNQSN